MKTLIVCALLLVSTWLSVPAMAVDVSGDQLGTWTLSESPYNLVGDVHVPPGETLVIEPGVAVVADGHYSLTVDQGTLLAIGTAEQPILMTAADYEAGWRGLRLEQADDSSTVSYCTIEYARGAGGFPAVRGGAILCKDCSPTISHNELRFNYSHNENYNGTGAGVTTWNSSATIADNHIHDNIADSGGGICCFEDGIPLIVRNTIADNTAYYAGGGIYIAAWTPARVENNIITGNWAAGWGGGGINSWASGSWDTMCIIRNNLIAGNTANTSGEARGGGGIYCRYDKCIATNNTIVDNSADQGGGVYVLNQGSSPPEFSNCIIWGNTATVGSQVFLCPSTDTVVGIQYSDVEGGWDGSGNIDQAPLFAGPDQDNYRLQAGSPCVDAGDSLFEPDEEETDLDGNDRLVDGDDNGSPVVDMGAYEHSGELTASLILDNAWMYQSLPGQDNSRLTATVASIDDPLNNSSYSYAWAFELAADVTAPPSTVSGGGAADSTWEFAAPSCGDGSLSDAGLTHIVRATITGDEHGNSVAVEVQFGIGLLGDVNNDTMVNSADRAIANSFWRTGAAGNFTLRDCDANCDGVANSADRAIINAIWRGTLCGNSASQPCPLR